MGQGTLDIVVGGQWGSESKGRTAAEVARRREQQGAAVIAVRVAGPNAGHTVYDDRGNRFALRQIPAAAVVSDQALLCIAAGSEVDFDVLRAEIELLEQNDHPVRERLLIHPYATWLEPKHREAEQGSGIVAAIGSTGKGIGAARADRIWRTALTVEQALNGGGWEGGDWADWFDLEQVERAGQGRAGTAWVLEGAQGYGLGLHTRWYPQTTSGDCTAVDCLAMARLNPWAWQVQNVRVHVVVRPNPIRVAGNSGPLLDETSWEQLGLPAEQTTVTRKTRRVGGWDRDLVAEALAYNGLGGGAKVRVALAMADHLVPEIAGATSTEEVWDRLSTQDGSFDRWMTLMDRIDDAAKLAGATGKLRLSLVGTGPATSVWWVDR